MSNLDELFQRLDILSKEFEDKLEDYSVAKKALSTVESSLIFLKEELRTLKEKIRIKQEASDFDAVIDRNREEDIKLFKERLKFLKFE